jgi:hypothetical protein
MQMLLLASLIKSYNIRILMPFIIFVYILSYLYLLDSPQHHNPTFEILRSTSNIDNSIMNLNIISSTLVAYGEFVYYIYSTEPNSGLFVLKIPYSNLNNINKYIPVEIAELPAFIVKCGAFINKDRLFVYYYDANSFSVSIKVIDPVNLSVLNTAVIKQNSKLIPTGTQYPNSLGLCLEHLILKNWLIIIGYDSMSHDLWLAKTIINESNNNENNNWEIQHINIPIFSGNQVSVCSDLNDIYIGYRDTKYSKLIKLSIFKQSYIISDIMSIKTNQDAINNALSMIIEDNNIIFVTRYGQENEWIKIVYNLSDKSNRNIKFKLQNDVEAYHTWCKLVNIDDKYYIYTTHTANSEYIAWYNIKNINNNDIINPIMYLSIFGSQSYVAIIHNNYLLNIYNTNNGMKVYKYLLE